MFGDRYNLFEELHYCFFFKVYFFLALKEHFDTRYDQEHSEHVYDPVKVLYHLDTCEYEYCPHDQSSDDSPEEYLVLVYLLDIKITKYHDKHKEIIHAERFFYDIPSQELERFFAPETEIDDKIENHSKRNPDHAPGDGFFELYLVSFFVENS